MPLQICSPLVNVIYERVLLFLTHFNCPISVCCVRCCDPQWRKRKFIVVNSNMMLVTSIVTLFFRGFSVFYWLRVNNYESLVFVSLRPLLYRTSPTNFLKLCSKLQSYFKFWSSSEVASIQDIILKLIVAVTQFLINKEFYKMLDTKFYASWSGFVFLLIKELAIFF